MMKGRDLARRRFNREKQRTNIKMDGESSDRGAQKWDGKTRISENADRWEML